MPSFRCPSCGKAYKWNESVAGKVVKCTACEQMMNVPSVSAASPSIDSASESIVAPLSSRRAGDYSSFKYAPVDPPKQKKNVYIILDAGDAAMVASFLALGVLLFGVGWMITKQFIIARPQAAPPAVIADNPDDEMPKKEEKRDVPVAKNGEKVLLVGGTCRLMGESGSTRAGAEAGVTLEVGIDYRLVSESIGGDGLTFLVVKGEDMEGRWPLEVIENSEGHLPLVFKMTGVSRESLSTLVLFVEGAGAAVISNKLELKPEIIDQPSEK